MNSMVEILSYYAGEKPNNLFVSDYLGNEYTYFEMWQKVKQVAYYLSVNLEIKQGDAILVECNNDADFLIFDFAIELIGAVFVPIEYNISDEKLRDITVETEAKALVARKKTVECIKNIDFETGLHEVNEIRDFSFPLGTSMAEILYTTGTTGKSKGIAISHEANVALAENIKYGVDMKDGNIELIPIPISHSHGLRCCYANLLNGGSVVLLDGLLNIKKVFKLMDEYKVTSIDISPSAVQLLIKISKGAFWQYDEQLDYIQIGTAALSESIKNQLIQGLPSTRLYNFYGSTESGRSCVLEFSKVTNKNNCIGKPTANAKIIFTDEERKEISASLEHPGLLASKGVMNMMGYWKNPQLTKEITGNGYIFSNDIGYADDEDYIYVIGRRDDVINYNGIKIAPEEIEEIAINYPEIKDVACVPCKDENAGQIPVLFVSTNIDKDVFDVKSYSAYLQMSIDGNKLPKRIITIDAIPRTNNGKVRRKELVERLEKSDF